MGQILEGSKVFNICQVKPIVAKAIFNEIYHTFLSFEDISNRERGKSKNANLKYKIYAKYYIPFSFSIYFIVKPY